MHKLATGDEVALAVGVACPACRAEVGALCRSGNIRYQKDVHQARWDLATKIDEPAVNETATDGSNDLSVDEELARRVSCSFCYVTPGERCQTPNGTKRPTSHIDRIDLGLRVNAGKARDAAEEDRQRRLAEQRAVEAGAVTKVVEDRLTAAQFNQRRFDAAIGGLRIARNLAGSDEAFIEMLARWIIREGLDHLPSSLKVQ